MDQQQNPNPNTMNQGFSQNGQGGMQQEGPQNRTAYQQYSQNYYRQGSPYQNRWQNGWQAPPRPVKPVNPDMEALCANTGYMWIAAVLYGLFYAFCVFRNWEGITWPFLAAGTMVFNLITLKRLGKKPHISSFFCYAGIIALGVSTCLTMNSFFHFFNLVGMLGLLAFAMLREYNDDSRWGLLGYLGRIIVFYVMMLISLPIPFQHARKQRQQEKQKEQTQFQTAENGSAGQAFPGANGPVSPQPNTKTARKTNSSAIAVGVIIGIAILAVVLPLLLSSDEIAAELFFRFFRRIDFSSIFFSFLTVVIGFFFFYTFFGSLAQHSLTKQQQPSREKFSAVIAITFTAILAVVYLFFSLIQMIYLFRGKSIIGVSYASYARTGFGQLLVVAVINLGIVLFVRYLYEKNTWLRILLSVITGSTVIFLASATVRMVFYIEEYHLTFLRVLVLWFLGVLALFMIGLFLHIWADRFPIFRYMVIVVSILYIGFSFSNADYRIARYDVEKMGVIDSDDMHFLTTRLSIDAAPVIADLTEDQLDSNSDDEEWWNYYDDPEDAMDEYFDEILDEHKNMSLREYNFSKVKAVKAAKDYKRR